jgi:uncharacterized phage protein (TIGR01671 family)
MDTQNKTQREIKFRAWEKPDEIVSFNGAMHYNIVGNDYFGKWLSSDEYVIMQFTGLKDRLGKEIYEGDILQTKGLTDDFMAEKITRKLEVKFSDGAFYTHKEFSVNENYLPIVANWGEVVGNIWENPELKLL